MNYQERKRQDVVASNLEDQIVKMFYGGNRPSHKQIVTIVVAFTKTEEWEISDWAAAIVITKVEDRLR